MRTMFWQSWLLPVFSQVTWHDDPVLHEWHVEDYYGWRPKLQALAKTTLRGYLEMSEHVRCLETGVASLA